VTLTGYKAVSKEVSRAHSCVLVRELEGGGGVDCQLTADITLSIPYLRNM
jgi:hypothetical protein